jgi:hypothetical protein
MKRKLNKLWDDILWFVVFHLPKKAIYFALIRAWAYATTGKYGHVCVYTLSMYDVVKVWETDHKIFSKVGI